jgi:hypothetical protein
MLEHGVALSLNDMLLKVGQDRSGHCEKTHKDQFFLKRKRRGLWKACFCHRTVWNRLIFGLLSGNLANQGPQPFDVFNIYGPAHLFDDAEP